MRFKQLLRLDSCTQATCYRVLVVGALVALTTICAFMVAMPSGYALWVFFIPIIALSFFSLYPPLPIVLAIFCSVWNYFDYFFIEHGDIETLVLFRRTMGVAAMFSVAFIVRYAIVSRLQREQVFFMLEKTTQDLELQKLKLEQSNRELERFASVAAHDLRSPISTIASWADFLNHKIPLPRDPHVENAAKYIKSCAEKADGIITDLLELARVDSSGAKVVPVDTNKLLKEVIASQQELIGITGAQIHADPLPVLRGNKTYFNSLFSNFISNALTYRDKSRRCEIFVGSKEEENHIEFFVKDNGIGIEKKHQQRVFDVFQRLHGGNEYPGTGIGLAICKKIVEHMGGRIWVDSEVGRGSTFYFTYPKKGVENETRSINN